MLPPLLRWGRLALFLVSVSLPCFVLEPLENDFFVLTVATNETDGYQRYMQSASSNNLIVKVLGQGEIWKGGDMNFRGGGYKINLLRRALKHFQLDDSTIVMFTDSYDVILLGGKEKILENFKALNASIVFSAELFCWPDKSLASDYPPTDAPYKFLNSGGFIGYAKLLYSLIDSHRLKNKDDDQLYFTNLYLDSEIRDKYNIRLDHNATIFQSAFGATADLKLVEDDKGNYILQNEATKTKPLVLHGNGPSKKVYLNSLGNYLAKARNSKNNTCLNCLTPNLPLVGSFPVILMGIFINTNTPFMEEFFEKISALDYPKSKINLYVYNKMPYHSDLVRKWVSEKTGDYASVKIVSSNESLSEALARNLALERCKLKNCNYYFSVDSVVHLDNPNVLQWLVQEQKGVVGPLLVRPFKAWSNFWGALNTEGYYSRSLDYMDIVNNDKRGLWNIPYLTHCYLINATLLPQLTGIYEDGALDPDMAFCQSIRDKGIFMFIENRIDFGHLIDPDDFDITKTNPEMYELFSNQLDWEKRYIHENYSMQLQEGAVAIQPCPDVYWFPIVTPRFCQELITIVETFGKWSSGSNYDERLAGGYENVPTRDIHMNQVDYERHWLHFLQVYVRPLQEKVFIGYFHDPPNSLLNFVVRYKPDEQPSLRPHHDSSTYTINLALNRRNIDYEGGGCKFLRYNCSVADTKIGWLLMHPGRLTHYHEGLPVTKGTRYIMISFVDP